MTPLNPTVRNPNLIAAVLFLGQFCGTFFIGFISALFVDISRDFELSVAMVGQATTLTTLTWAVTALLMGPVSDRLGRRTMIIIGLLIASVAILGMSLSRGITSFLAFSILLGIGGALEGPNQIASIADYFQLKHMGKMLAIIQTGGSLAVIIGIPIGVYVAGKISWQASLVMVSLLALTTMISFAVVLPHVKPHKKTEGRSFSASMRTALRWKPLIPLLAANVLSQGGFFLVYTYLVASIIQRYSISTAEVAPMIPFIGAGQLLGVLFGSPLIDRFDRAKTCAITQLIFGVFGFLFMVLSPNIWISIIMGGIFIAVWAVNRPSFLAIVSLAPSEVRSTAMGMQATSNNIGRAIGIGFGGLALTVSGYGLIGFFSLPLTIISAAIFYFSVRGVTPTEE